MWVLHDLAKESGGPVTDPLLPDEAVEAGARALYEHQAGSAPAPVPPFDQIHEGSQDSYRAQARAVLEASFSELPDGNVWHKDGAVAQILWMAEWADRMGKSREFDSETLGKIATNLRAAVPFIEKQVREQVAQELRDRAEGLKYECTVGQHACPSCGLNDAADFIEKGGKPCARDLDHVEAVGMQPLSDTEPIMTEMGHDGWSGLFRDVWRALGRSVSLRRTLEKP